MARLFTGPVELSEYTTPDHNIQFVGTTLRFNFRISEDQSNPNESIFPEVNIQVSRVGTWHLWQQHEVWLNDHLIGTINLRDDRHTVFVFPFQPKLIKIDPSDIWKVAQENVNVLEVKLGTGGFGLNDSFDVNWIEINNLKL